MPHADTILTVAGCLAGIALIVRLLDCWCRPVRYTQLMRFPGNEAARQAYELRAEMGGHLVRERRPTAASPGCFICGDGPCPTPSECNIAGEAQR